MRLPMRSDGEIKSKHKPPVCSLIRVSVNQCSGYFLGYN